MTALNHGFFDLLMFMVTPEDSTGYNNNPLPLLANNGVRTCLNVMKTALWVGVAMVLSIAISGL